MSKKREIDLIIYSYLSVLSKQNSTSSSIFLWLFSQISEISSRNFINSGHSFSSWQLCIDLNYNQIYTEYEVKNNVMFS